MADIYSDIPELSAEQANIVRRQKIAQMIQSQAMQGIPSQPQMGRYAVPTNPLLALGKIGEAYFGKQAADNADAKQAALSDKYNTIANADRQSVVDALVSKGTPAQPAIPLPQDESGNEMTRPAQPAMPGEPMSLLDKQQALIQNYGTLKTDRGRKENELQQKYIEAQLVAQQKVQDRADTKANTPYYKDFQTAKGIGILDTRSGNINFPKDGNGDAILGSNSDPRLQGNIASSKEGGKEQSKDINTSYNSARSAQQELMGIDEANKALDSGSFQGSGADTKLAVSKFINANIPGMNIDPNKVANTDYLRTQFGGALLSNAKTLGINPTDTDARRIEDIVGTIGKDPKAMRMVLDWRAEMAQRAIDNHNSVYDQATQNGYHSLFDMHVKGRQPTENNRRASDNLPQYEKTATNPKTGQKLGLRNGQWEPIQ